MRSVKNKDQIILQELNNNNTDVALITEIGSKIHMRTWNGLTNQIFSMALIRLQHTTDWVKGGVVVLHLSLAETTT